MDNDQLNQADEAVTSPLNLNATSLEQFRSLTIWHLEFAKENPRTFRELMTLLTSLGIRYQTLQVNSRMFNFAQQSFSSAQKLRFLDQLERLAYLPQFSPCGGAITSPKISQKTPNLEDQWQAGVERQKDYLRQHSKLDELFKHSISQIKNERNQEILRRRLGLSPFEAHTLQEAGDAVGITRERVRQLVKKEMIKLETSCLWDDVFREEIDQLFQHFGPLLPLDNLPSMSSWFEGFELTVKSWEAFVEFFSPDTSVLKNESSAWLAPNQLVPSLEKIARLYSELRSKGASETELDAMLADTTDIKVPDVEFFRGQISDYAHEGKVTDASLVRKFLSEINTEFDLDDFYHFCMRNDHVIDPSNSRSITNRFGDSAAPVSRRPTRYVSRATLEICNPNIEYYIDQFAEYWHENFSEDRVFHGDEVRDWALTQKLSFQEKWGSWWAVAPLKLDNEERFEANKLVVTLSKCWKGRDIPTRRELIEELLAKRGVPMRAKEIVKELHPKMGFGDVYQINDEGNIRALGGGLFDFRGD